MPAAVLGGEGAARGEVMDVRMKLKLAAPGVQDSEEAGQVAADILGVGGQSFDGVGRGVEQGRIAQALVTADKGSEQFGDGEGDQEVVARELFLQVSV